MGGAFENRKGKKKRKKLELTVIQTLLLLMQYILGLFLFPFFFVSEYLLGAPGAVEDSCEALF